MPDLPTGTVTFLFTDIEGSTTRWEHHRQAMQTALARHDALMREIIAAHAGTVFKTVGDAVCAVFPTATAALEAAIAAQRAIRDGDWAALGLDPLAVRMAVHTGVAELRDGDYFGRSLNRVARLLAAGHGGQVLLSAATQELVRDQLPPPAELRSLGEHRLKDLIRPEHIFQLLAPDLAHDFPPLRTLEHRPNNLPLQPTPFLGRERELAAVATLLRTPSLRLLTLTGPGGTGKTRLALQAVADALDDFADGVWFVNLAPIGDPTLVISTIAQMLDVQERGQQPLGDLLMHYLRDKALLLLLDNFEQVTAAAPAVADLLGVAPRLRVLVTSRAPLRLRGEHEYSVPPFAVPDPQRLPALATLTQYDAVRLFIARAQEVRADFAVTHANAPAVAEICVRLDGLPLAIELAAARVRLFPPQALLARLGSRLTLLTGGARDLPARQQTLRGAIDWSYSLLQPDEQLLFARLAVFLGGCTFEAIEAVCNPDGALDVLAGVESLVEKSLLRQAEGSGDEPRFVLLETILEYAEERLDTDAAAARNQSRYATYFPDLAEQAEPELTGQNQIVWLHRLDSEYENVRAVLERALGQGRNVPLAVRLAGAMWWFWSVRGQLSEGRRWLEMGLGRLGPGTATMPLRAKALNGAGWLAFQQGDYASAQRFSAESLALSRDLGDQRGRAIALLTLGVVAFHEHDYVQAQERAQESLALFRGLGDRWGIGNVLVDLGNVACAQGDWLIARQRYEESLAQSQALGERQSMAYALGSLGIVASGQEDFAAAYTYYEACLSLLREVGDKYGIAITFKNLADVAYAQGDVAAARMRYIDSLEQYRELGHQRGIAGCLEGLAAGAGAEGQPRRAAWLFGAAEARRDASGAPLQPGDRLTYSRDIAAARAQLDDATWEVAWAEGRAMSLEQVVAYALADTATFP